MVRRLYLDKVAHQLHKVTLRMPFHAQHPHTDAAITLHLRPESLVVSPRFGTSYTFDRAGRLLSLFLAGHSYQRALDGSLLERGRARGIPRRRPVPPDEAGPLLDAVFADLDDLAGHLPQIMNGTATQADNVALRDMLDTARAFDPTRLDADAAAYRTLYKPVNILPPDQYRAVVLQATEGCSWNRCTFCSFYRDRPFRIHTPADFQAHCAAVRDYFGAGLSFRRGIFLADANALCIPQPRLVALLEAAQTVFAAPTGPRPVFSFVSAFDVAHKTPDDWRMLAGLGLQRAYIGLETGDPALLDFLKKPGTVQDAIDAVATLRAGGVSVGVIVMAGIGGERYAANHVRRSVEAVARMALGAEDQVYISNYVALADSEYDYQMTVSGIRALTDAEVNAQYRALRAGMRRVVPQTVVAPYRVDGFAV